MSNQQTIYLAAGCFWGVQYYFDQMPGVVETEAGYVGGTVDQPTYEMVCSHGTGHAEAVRIVYDSDTLSTETLLKHFFALHDPTQLNRQGPDVGDQYRSAIFYSNEAQKETANAVIASVNETDFHGRVVTEVEPETVWWPAEDYHQKYTEKTGRGMCHTPYRPL